MEERCECCGMVLEDEGPRCTCVIETLWDKGDPDACYGPGWRSFCLTHRSEVRE